MADVMLEEFTPAVLLHLEEPPVFLLRRPSSRAERDLEHQMHCEGLRHHSAEALREEALRGLKKLWPADAFEAHAARLRVDWAALDAGKELPDGEAEALEDLTARLTTAWPPLARMVAENARARAETRRLAVGMVVAGWTGLDVPYRREIVVPLEVMDRVEERLAELERAAAIPAGTAFFELGGEALRLIQRGGEEDEAPTPPKPSPKPRRRPAPGKRRRATKSQNPEGVNQ